MNTTLGHESRNVIRISARSGSSASAETRSVQCSNCNLREVCLPRGLASADSSHLDKLIHLRRRIRRGESLYRAGATFTSLYAVRSGFFKSYAVSDDGREQVTGFQMAGEIIGLDGIDANTHHLNVQALEDSIVCVIQFTRLEELAAGTPAVQRQLHRIMSREIVRDQAVMMLLGGMQAEERVVALLLNLSQRFAARGYAAGEFVLRMTREEIGSYLGLKLETVSRVFSKLQQSGLIDVQNKHIRLCRLPALKAMLGRAA